MKCLPIFALSSLLLIGIHASAQSGRRGAKPAPVPSPTVEPSPDPANKATENKERSQVAAIAGEEYRCTNDGTLAVVVQSSEAEHIFAPDEVTTKAKITSRPAPEYTKEARRRAVQGTIQFRVVLAATGKVASVKILKGLPFGLNESAIHAACKIEFRPALKDGQPVTQWLKGEYTFRLESSIFRP
jgi:TonB family protein